MTMMLRGKSKRMEEWIKEAIADVENGPITALALFHMVGAQFGQQVDARKMLGVTSDHNDLAERFRGKAEVHAQVLPGTQLFNLVAFYGNDDREPKSRYPFELSGKSHYEGGGLGPSDTPDAKGQVSQGMRWMEQLLSQTFNHQQKINGTMIEINDRREARISRLESENDRMFDLFRAMMVDKLQAEHDREYERLKYQRETQERAAIIGFVPMLLNTVLGREVFPMNAADTMLIDSLAESLNKEDVEKLMMSGIIKPQLMGPLYKRMEVALAKLAKREEETRAMFPAMKNPEDEAAGDAEGSASVRVDGETGEIVQ